MTLSTLLSPTTIRRFDRVVDKWRLIEELASELACAAGGLDAAEVAQAMSKRERELSTGLECGLAIPHGLLAPTTTAAAFLALIPNGIDFDTLDRKPAHLVLALAVPNHPEGRAQHLRVLAQAAALLTRADTRAALLSAADGTQAHAALIRAEIALAASKQPNPRV